MRISKKELHDPHFDLTKKVLDNAFCLCDYEDTDNIVVDWHLARLLRYEHEMNAFYPIMIHTPKCKEGGVWGVVEI